MGIFKNDAIFAGSGFGWFRCGFGFRRVRFGCCGGFAISLEPAEFLHFIFAAFDEVAFLQPEIVKGFFEALADVPLQSDGIAFSDQLGIFFGEDFAAYDERGGFETGDAAETPA